MNEQLPQPPSGPSQYEFDSTQNTSFASLAGSMKIVAIIMMICGVLAALNILAGDFVAAVIGGVYIVMGIWTKGAAQSIRNIVNTEGNDIDHLMSAVKDLGKFYALVKWLLIVGIVLGFFAAYAAAAS